jgi:HAD superfamily phosphatase (TIGR01668 family)
MRHPGAGEYDKESMPKGLRRFSPKWALNELTDADLGQLKESGCKLVLLDVDNTLLPWREEEIDQSVHDWIAEGKAHDMQFCILSNTKRPDRLARISEKLGVDHIRGKFKPSRQMYFQALEKYGVEPGETVMIGDQLLTDILGANRAGIDAIWAKPINKREFVGTRFLSRNVEKVIGVFIATYFSPERGDLKKGLMHSETFRQALKFIVVGGTSFIIDYSITMTIWKGLPVGDVLGQAGLDNLPSLFTWAEDASSAGFPIAKALGAGTAMVYNFWLNRRWTFRATAHAGKKEQFAKFLLISGTGMLWNIFLASFFKQILPFTDVNNARVGILIATGFVAVWNFTGQKLFAFRRKDA